MSVAKELKNEARGRKSGTTKRGPKRDSATGKYALTASGILELVTLSLALMSKGGALRWGLTRDGGALAIGVYFGDDYGTEYVRPNEDLPTACEEIFVAWTGGTAGEYRQRAQLVAQGDYTL